MLFRSPFINEPDPYQNFDFLKDWAAFVQKLSNVFSSYSPEDDNEDAIISISFPNDGKAVNYFIQFAKYQNHIRWDDRSLRKVVKDVLPNRIREELRFSHEDVSTFKGLKRAVSRIDNDFWKRHQEDKNKLRTVRTLPSFVPRTPRLDSNRFPNAPEGPPNPDRWYWEKPRLSPLSPLTTRPDSSQPLNTNILGPDGRLTPVERQCRLALGLCMHCGQPGHLTHSCPRQSHRTPAAVEAHATYLEDSLVESEHQKK